MSYAEIDQRNSPVSSSSLSPPERPTASLAVLYILVWPTPSPLGGPSTACPAPRGGWAAERNTVASEIDKGEEEMGVLRRDECAWRDCSRRNLLLLVQRGPST